LACLLSGCGGKKVEGQGARAPHDAEDAAARITKMMARENGPFSKHKIELLEGLATGEIEAREAPRPECQKDEDGFRVCSIGVDLGKDADGDPNSIGCAVTTKLGAFGPTIKALLREGDLEETPTVEVKPLGEGIVAVFVASFSHKSETGVAIGTLKVATLYAHGYMTTCFDAQTGGKKTFPRIVEAFFQSLKFKDWPAQPTMFAHGYRERTGERTTGFRYRAVARDAEHFVEMATAFSLNTDGKTWNVADFGAETIRDKSGAVESIRELYWADGKGPAVLSAKPSEGGKFRIKFEAGTKSDALEATPAVALSSELWSAPELAKLSSGTLPKYRYASLDLRDGDPAFRYVSLSRTKPGVLLEEPETAKRGKSAPESDPQTRNTLEVDARGIVTKQVSANSVFELVYTWGQLPSVPARGSSAKGKSAP
jgi:hypothetical protein